MREQPPPPCNPHRPGTPATPPAPTALWSGTGSASFNLPCCATSFLRTGNPCPDLNDRRAAPPWWGSVAALPLPCGPRRYRQHRMTTIAVMDEAAMNYPVAEVRNGNAQRQLLHGAPRLHDEVAAATSAKPRT